MQRNYLIPVTVTFNINDIVDCLIIQAFAEMKVNDVTAALNALNHIEQALKQAKALNQKASLDGKVVGLIKQDTNTFHFRNMTTLRQAFTFFGFDLSRPVKGVPKLQLTL